MVDHAAARLSLVKTTVIVKMRQIRSQLLSKTGSIEMRSVQEYEFGSIGSEII